MIRKAESQDFDKIVELIDGGFTKEGFGFVNRSQIKTEIRKGRVLVAEEAITYWAPLPPNYQTNYGYCEIVGCRIGLGTVWNIFVSKSHRGQGIGRELIDYYRPHTVRVKSDPVGHLSKKQKENFVDPTDFYEKMGFRFWGRSFPRNFWQRAGDKAKFHTKGEIPHIKIYKDPLMVMDL